MRNSMKYHRPVFLLILFIAIITLASGNTSAQSAAITLDHLEGGSISQGLIFIDQPIRFHIRATNNTGADAYSVYGVFQINSPDGAVWDPIDFDTTDQGWQTMFDGLIDLNEFAVTGSDADTACFCGFSIFGSGMMNGFDEVSWIISTSVDSSQEGKTICLDSVTSSEFNCDWLWNTNAGLFAPMWDGPHCFTISIAGCCTGVRGNVNPNGGDNPNILDLTWSIAYIFRGQATPGPCPEESDVNGDGAVLNILDLTFLVDYIFRGGPLPGPCP